MNRTTLMLSGATVAFAADSAAASGAATTAAAVKAKTVLEDMDSRRIFANATEATAYLNKCAADFSDFDEIPMAATGLSVSDKGEALFDPALYTADTKVMVATLRSTKPGAASKIKAVVITPIPTLEALLKAEGGEAWVNRILEKELNHVAVRPLRDAADVSTVVDQMPQNLAAFISSAREAGTGIMAAFDDLYKSMNATLSSKLAVWNKARLTKPELKRALESKGYALEYYPALENRGEGKDSLFVVFLNTAINVAKGKGLDPTIFERWLSTRDAKAFDATAEEEEDDFDAASLSESMLTEAPAAETDATAQA